MYLSVIQSRLSLALFSQNAGFFCTSSFSILVLDLSIFIESDSAARRVITHPIVPISGSSGLVFVFSLMSSVRRYCSSLMPLLPISKISLENAADSGVSNLTKFSVLDILHSTDGSRTFFLSEVSALSTSVV